jgi:S-adenosylmethionine synthetase
VEIDKGRNLFVAEFDNKPMFEQEMEFVERKGLGHPDSICDAIAEEGSIALCKEYLSQFDMVLHHNLDKGLLIAGAVDHKFGGGIVIEPMRLIIGDRATYEYENKRIQVDKIVRASAKRWVRDNLRFVDPDTDLRIEVELKPGSPELTGMFKRGKKEIMPANDTSATIGYAPLTPTENMILNVERYLSSTGFKEIFPAAGDDIKIMGYRKGKSLQLTIAMPLVDRFVGDSESYFEQKRKIVDHINDHVREFIDGGEPGLVKDIKIFMNTLDKPDQGIDGIYTTVTGTSAEDADSGEVGRGNRVNGLIAFNRPIGAEAAAGKNPVSHVGKIYTVLSHRIAAEIYNSVEGVAEAYVWLCSRIGEPIDNPRAVSVQLVLKQGIDINIVKPRVQEVVDLELSNMKIFVEELSAGTYRVM